MRQFDEDGLIAYAGDLRRDDVTENVEKMIDRFRKDFALRKKSSNGMQTIVDGKGAERLAQALINM